MMIPGKPFILGSKGQRSRSRVTNTFPAWVLYTLVSAGFVCLFVNCCVELHCKKSTQVSPGSYL